MTSSTCDQREGKASSYTCPFERRPCGQSTVESEVEVSDSAGIRNRFRPIGGEFSRGRAKVTYFAIRRFHSFPKRIFVEKRSVLGWRVILPGGHRRLHKEGCRDGASISGRVLLIKEIHGASRDSRSPIKVFELFSSIGY